MVLDLIHMLQTHGSTIKLFQIFQQTTITILQTTLQFTQKITQQVVLLMCSMEATLASIGERLMATHWNHSEFWVSQMILQMKIMIIMQSTLLQQLMAIQLHSNTLLIQLKQFLHQLQAVGFIHSMKEWQRPFHKFHLEVITLNLMEMCFHISQMVSLLNSTHHQMCLKLFTIQTNNHLQVQWFLTHSQILLRTHTMLHLHSQTELKKHLLTLHSTKKQHKKLFTTKCMHTMIWHLLTAVWRATVLTEMASFKLTIMWESQFHIMFF